MTPRDRFVLGALFVILGWVIFGLAIREFGWQPSVVIIGDGAMYGIVARIPVIATARDNPFDPYRPRTKSAAVT